MTFEDELGSRYEVVEHVGSGGQATVLRARDLQHDRLVALKVYDSEGDTPRDMLLGEADVLLRLTPHPGLPIVRDDFFLSDRYVIVMDWIDGRDLQHVLAERGDPGLPFSQVTDWIVQVASALDHLHQHVPPVVHGDVKPANVILTANGRVVLVDFGIALEAAGRRSPGTRGFRAPEVAAGAPLSPAADVFGLAATAFTLLTGTPPSGADPDWVGLDPDRVGSAARTLRRALSTRPETRPSSAGELGERLRSAALPSGDVTFLMTELADAERLWEEHGSSMRPVCNRLDDLTCEVVEGRGGRIVRSGGESESMLSVFSEASSAVAAALGLQDRVQTEVWPTGHDIRLRAALHTGEAELRDGRYVGPVVTRVSRLRALATPGTTIVSRSTAHLATSSLAAAVALVDLGERSLEGSTRPEHVFRLESSAPPPPPVPAPPTAPPALPVPTASTKASSSEPNSRQWERPTTRRKRGLPEHWKSRRTADAIMAPSAIVLGGGAAAVAIVAGAALPVVLIAGAGAWAARVAIAMPKQRRERIDPYALGSPWRSFVLDALDAHARYQRACRHATAGPLHDRLVEIEQRVDTGVQECWRVAQRGDALGKAIVDLDLDATRSELEAAEANLRSTPSPTRQQTVESLRAKVQSGDRLAAVESDAIAQLELVNARLDESVARAVELSNRADTAVDVGGLGGDIDGLVGELETLRGALDEAAGQPAVSRRAT